MSKSIDVSKLGAPIKFYNDTVTLRFSEDEWTYYLVGEDGSLTPQDGVTKIVHIINKPYLIPWAAKMVYVKMLKTMPRRDDGHTKSIPWDEFEQILLSAKNAHKDKLEDAGDVGGLAHSWLEASILNAISFNGGIVDQMNDMAPTDERAVNCGNAAHGWMKAHNVRWLLSEKKVYSRKYGYAGTMDGLALVDSCNNPACCQRIFQDELSLIDWKSSNQLSLEYLYQTAAYVMAYMEEHPGRLIKARWILRLSKDGAGEPLEAWYESEVMDDFFCYLACLSLSRLNSKIEKRMSEAKKLKTFKKREAAKVDKAAEKLGNYIVNFHKKIKEM